MFKHLNLLSSLQTETLERTRERFEKCKSTKSSFHKSPSGKYNLEIQSGNEKEVWNYSKGVVYQNGKRLGEVFRNYSKFPHAWIENHIDGNDYLICGSDYTGQTIVCLNQVTRMDSDDTCKPQSWIWAEHYPNPTGDLIAVIGCPWGGMYSVKVFDFRTPQPNLIKVAGPPHEHITGLSWEDDRTLKYNSEVEWSLLYDKNVWDLTEEEDLESERRLDEGEVYSSLYEMKVLNDYKIRVNLDSN